MKSLLTAGSLFAVLLTAAAEPVAYDPAKLPKGAEYFQLRQGLGNSYRAFTERRQGRVAFLGGSITAMSGWREKTIAYFRQKFPDTQFDFISAGVPSLGSVPHAFRLQRDVLARGPVDLLFVEAAVNDSVNSPGQADAALRGMEGIVRQARCANPKIDIVHLHFASPDHMTAYRDGRVPLSIVQHEKVAAAYGNATLDLAREVTERIDAGQFTWEKDFRDLHPSPFGQQLYADSIARLLNAAFAGRPPMDHHLLPEPVDAHSYFRGHFGDLARAQVHTGFQYVARWKPSMRRETRTGYVDIPALTASEPGASFTYPFEGTAIGLMLAAGPEAGMIEASCDGKPPRRLDTFTAWSESLFLPWALIIDDQLAPGPHTLRIKLLDEKNPKSRGTALHIADFLEN